MEFLVLFSLSLGLYLILISIGLIWFETPEAEMPLKEKKKGILNWNYWNYQSILLPCPRQSMLSSVNIGHYVFTLQTFQCPAEYSQQFSSPVNHKTASSWLFTKTEMKSDTDNPKQKNNQNASYIFTLECFVWLLGIQILLSSEVLLKKKLKWVCVP